MKILRYHLTADESGDASAHSHIEGGVLQFVGVAALEGETSTPSIDISVEIPGGGFNAYGGGSLYTGTPDPGEISGGIWNPVPPGRLIIDLSGGTTDYTYEILVIVTAEAG